LIIEHNGDASPENYKKYLPFYLIIYLFNIYLDPLTIFKSKQIAFDADGLLSTYPPGHKHSVLLLYAHMSCYSVAARNF